LRIRTLIVDDEPPAISRVRRFLDRDPDVEVVGACGDGATAVSTIRDLHPDLVLLDVQMPEMDGFEVVSKVGLGRMPVTIFVTAHDRYALRAFEVHALDYLLKPFGKARFTQALSRAKEQLGGKLNRDALRAVVAMLSTGTAHAPTERLPVAHDGRIIFLDMTEIDWIEASGNYVRLHAGAREYELRETLTCIEQKLNPRDFVRIHRSTIVNVRSIKEIHRWFRGHHLVVLNGGQELRMSRYQREVAKRLGLES